MSNEKVREFIKYKVAKANNFDSFERAIRYTFNRPLLQSEHEFITKLIDESMQAYADQVADEVGEKYTESFRRMGAGALRIYELEKENASLKEALVVARKYMMCPIEMDGLEYMKETEIVRQHLTNNPCNHPKGSVLQTLNYQRCTICGKKIHQ